MTTMFADYYVMHKSVSYVHLVLLNSDVIAHCVLFPLKKRNNTDRAIGRELTKKGMVFLSGTYQQQNEC